MKSYSYNIQLNYAISKMSTNHFLPTANCFLPTARCFLPLLSADCPLPTTDCLLLTNLIKTANQCLKL